MDEYVSSNLGQLLNHFVRRLGRYSACRSRVALRALWSVATHRLWGANEDGVVNKPVLKITT